MTVRDLWERLRKPPVRPPEETVARSLTAKAASLSDAGGREKNEDCCLVRIPAPEEPAFSRGWLAVVSDGMGGHNGGARASRIAVECVADEYYRSPEAPARSLRSALFAANRSIWKEARRNRPLEGMGATCTVLAGVGDQAFLAHVGDTRLYLLRNGVLTRLTEDHSQVMDEVRRGLISAEEARTQQRRNIVVRALGVRELALTVWDTPLSLQAGDRFILCTDGLSNTLDDEEIHQTAGAPDCEEACRDLIRVAAERQATDNITAVVLDILAQAALPAEDGSDSAAAAERQPEGVDPPDPMVTPKAAGEEHAANGSEVIS
jgi:protein phosphatase